MIAIAIFAITGFVIYSSFFGPSSSSTTVSSTATTTISTEGQDIIYTASKIDTVSIDSTIFSSPLFTNLIDFDTSPSPEAQGRPNPFADIGNDSNAQVFPVSVPTISTSSTHLIKPTK
jgi:hypothetical protein